MFSVDRVTVVTFQGSPLRMVDGVTQLLSTKTLKEKVGKGQLVRSELVEELNSLSPVSVCLSVLSLCRRVRLFLSKRLLSSCLLSSSS